MHQLFPSAATQWKLLVEAARKEGYSVTKFNISYKAGAAYRSLEQQATTFAENGPGKAAEPGTSVHGWGAAVDIQQLYTAANGSADPSVNANVRNNNSLYQWLNTNAATYGWINPPKLKDGSGADEAWHWEYWGPISGGAIGASEVQAASQPVVTVETVVAALRDAASGFGTNEAALEDVINRIPDRAFFLQVNSKLPIENLLNNELGSGDRATVDTIKAKLKTLGITLTYIPISTQGGGNQGVKDIKIIL